MTNEEATFIFTYYEIRFGIIRFGSVNDTEALVFRLFGFYPLRWTTDFKGQIRGSKGLRFGFDG